VSVIARPTALTGSDQLVRTGPGRYLGITVRETAGAVASVRVFDNTAASGTVIDAVSLAANAAWTTYVAGDGLRVDTGIYVDIISGTVEGSVRLG
jgi:hypothetical protein